MTLRKPFKIAATLLLCAVFVTAAWIGIDRFREAREDRAYDAKLDRIVSLMELPAEGDVQARFDRIVGQIRAVIAVALRGRGHPDIDSAAHLLALAVSYRHSVARHDTGPDLRRELDFIAAALA